MSIDITNEDQQRYKELQEMALGFARKGDMFTLQRMIKVGIDVNLKDHRGNSLLMLSAYNGRYETSKMLIENGADIDGVNNYGQGILAGVAFKGYLQICKLLVENGAHIDTKLANNPLFFASMFGRKEVFYYLQEQRKRSLKLRFLGNLSCMISLFRIGKRVRKIA